MIYCSETTKSAYRVQQRRTTTYLINNKNAEISVRHAGRTKQFTSDAPMMERIFKCQFSELIGGELLHRSRYIDLNGADPSWHGQLT